MEIPKIEGPGWLEWRVHPKTQEFLQMLRDSVETDKENWLQGDFHSSSDYHHSLVLEAAARATANTCARIVFAIEEIKAPEEKSEE